MKIGKWQRWAGAALLAACLWGTAVPAALAEEDDEEEIVLAEDEEDDSEEEAAEDAENTEDTEEEADETEDEEYGDTAYYYSYAEPVAKRNYSPQGPAVQREMRPMQTRGEMAAMDYAPLYPVFAWEPYAGATGYQVEVLREEQGHSEHLTYCYTDENDYYADNPLNRGGVYSWRVRALDALGEPFSLWSTKETLTVTAPTPVAALGDSITHGGGAGYPACFKVCNWETYAGLPVKNLGRSGNTTRAMANRFVADVVPFAPRVLVIMGGVNDFREGTPAKESIRNLKEIRKLCKKYDIIPVFATATPINPAKIARIPYIEDAYPDWLQEQQQLNAWIMRQPYAVDAAAALTAADGTLRSELTTDGLHPDKEGKQLLGEAIGNYLRENGLTMQEAGQEPPQLSKAEQRAKRKAEKAARRKQQKLS